MVWELGTLRRRCHGWFTVGEGGSDVEEGLEVLIINYEKLEGP